MSCLNGFLVTCKCPEALTWGREGFCWQKLLDLAELVFTQRYRSHCITVSFLFQIDRKQFNDFNSQRNLCTFIVISSGSCSRFAAVLQIIVSLYESNWWCHFLTRLYFGQVDDCTGPASAKQTQIILHTVTNFSLQHANWNASLGFFAVPPWGDLAVMSTICGSVLNHTPECSRPAKCKILLLSQRCSHLMITYSGGFSYILSEIVLKYSFQPQWCQARSKTRSTLIIFPLNIHLVVLHTGFVVYGGDWREYLDEMNWTVVPVGESSSGFTDCPHTYNFIKILMKEIQL